MDSHMESVTNRAMNSSRSEKESLLTHASVHTHRSAGLMQGAHSENHSAVFKHCSSRREKMPSPSHDIKRDDLKYIDEEATGNHSDVVTTEICHSYKSKVVIPTTSAGKPVVSAPISDTMIRSCSVGYLDVFHSQLVPCEVTLAMLRKEAPKRLVLVNKKSKNHCNRRANAKKQNHQTPDLNLKLDSKAVQSTCTKTPHLKSCGKSKSLDSSDMFLMTHNTCNDINLLPPSIEETNKSSTEENEYETIECVKSSSSGNGESLNLSTNLQNKTAKEFTKLSFFTSSKTPIANRMKKRDLPVCDMCKCVTPSSNSYPSTLHDISSSESYVCNACLSSGVCNTPTKKSKNLFKESKRSPGSDKSRNSSPRHTNDRQNVNSEIEIGNYF